MKIDFDHRVFRNVDDHRIYEYGLRLQKTRLSALNLIKKIIEKNKDVKVTIGLAAGILFRIIECVLSIELLAIKGRARDSAVLLLNVIELRVDLEYIALDLGLESIWLEHQSQWGKPWKITRQIKEIYKDKNDAKSELSIYRQCSMAKHGNPAGGTASFQLYMHDKKHIGVETGSNLNLLRTPPRKCAKVAGLKMRDN